MNYENKDVGIRYLLLTEGMVDSRQVRVEMSGTYLNGAVLLLRKEDLQHAVHVPVQVGLALEARVELRELFTG